MDTTQIDIFEPHKVDLFAPATESATVADISVPADLRYTRRASNREYLHALHVANAAKHLERLPNPGESIHAIMKGNYNGWDLVPAVLRLAKPTTIADLSIATLGFNQANTIELLRLCDAGQIGAVIFLCSVYFRAHNEGEFEFLATELDKRGQRILALRNHAKLLLMRLQDGRCIVIESSANLRSCRNIEQFVMTHDEGLYEFHKRWMDAVVRQEEAAK